MRSFREWQTERAQHFAVKHVLITGPDLPKINWAFINFPLSGKIYVINFSHLHKLA